MLTTGSQLEAAHALAGMTRTKLASLARLNVSAIAGTLVRARRCAQRPSVRSPR
jgi:hypothetical protein